MMTVPASTGAPRIALDLPKEHYALMAAAQMHIEGRLVKPRQTPLEEPAPPADPVTARRDSMETK
jgi:hypothetical protein